MVSRYDDAGSRVSRLSVIALAALSVAGCSQRAVYDNIQLNQRHQCERGPPAVYEDCIEGVSRPYDQYARERQEYLKAREIENDDGP